MRKTTIRLTDIPRALLPVITSTDYGTIWLNGGLRVKAIHIYKDRQYRLTTDKGEYRYGIDNDDITLDITT